MIDKERYILEALQKVVVGMNLSIPVKYVGRTISIPSDGKWLELIYIPATTTDDFWSEGKRYKGAFRILLHWPMDNSGSYPAMDFMRDLASYFEKGSKFTDSSNNVTVDIIAHPFISDIIEEAPELLIPLTIRYACFTM